MMRLSEILDVDLLDHYLADGVVRRQVHPDDPYLHIYKYTERAVALGDWTPTLRACRGLIVREGEVMARAFDKFFNSTEPQSQWLWELTDDPQVTAYDKVDGSLGIMYRAPDGLPAIATMGSFASEQAVHATAVLRERYGEWAEGYLSSAGGQEFTVLFEIVYPENRIVVDYGDLDDLTMLGLSFHEDDSVATPEVVDVGWPGPVAEIVHQGRLSEVLSLPERPGKEGVVVVINGERVKIKQESYVALHRIVTGLSERTVWEKLGELGYDGTVAWANETLDAEHATWVQDVSLDLGNRAYDLMERADIDAFRLAEGTTNRGEFARKVMAHTDDRNERAGLFLAYDKNLDRLRKWAHASVRPDGNAKVGSPVGGHIQDGVR